MRHRNRIRAGCRIAELFVSIVLLAFIPRVVADELEPLHLKLAAFESLHAAFEQQGNEGTHRGELWVARPNLFRIETTTPWRQTLVSDGESFWNYDADLEQLVISSLENDLRKFPILLFASSEEELGHTYNVVSYEDEMAQVYVLEPKSEQRYFQTVTLVFDGQVPSSIIILDAMGQRTQLHFQAPELNPPLAAGLFGFTAPGDTDVVDQRAKPSDS